jgi:hypothetical protein
MRVVCHPIDHVEKFPPRRVIAPVDHATFSEFAFRTGIDAVRPTRAFSCHVDAGTPSTITRPPA